MIKSFCVAEHTFQLGMPDDCSLWSSLSQYSPFETGNVTDSLFRLDVVDSIPEVDKTPLLVDGPSEEGAPRIDLYDAGSCLYMDMAVTASAPVCGCLIVDKNIKRGQLKIMKCRLNQALFAVNNSLMLMYAFATACTGTLEMHSSVVVNDGRGYMFLGRSGTGKSTHSSLWLKYISGSELLNDDNPILRVSEDGTVRVFGSPWSGKTPCYRNSSAPVGAIVRIKQAPFNRITRMNILESYASVYSSCSGFKADRTMSDGLHETLERIALNIPCYTLECLPDEEAALICSTAVKKSEKLD